MTKRTRTQLADARSASAAALEQAIAALGSAYAEYLQATRTLELRVNAELERYLQPAIALHLARAGLVDFLERKLAGVAPSLRGLVEQQHRRSNVSGVDTE